MNESQTNPYESPQINPAGLLRREILRVKSSIADKDLPPCIAVGVYRDLNGNYFAQITSLDWPSIDGEHRGKPCGLSSAWTLTYNDPLGALWAACKDIGVFDSHEFPWLAFVFGFLAGGICWTLFGLLVNRT